MTTTATNPPVPRQHWRALTDAKSDCFTVAELFAILEEQGRKDVHVRIASATGGSVVDFESNKKIRKVMVKLVGIEKPLGLNVTNCRAIESITGSPFPSDWAGAVVTLYVGKAERGRRKGDPEGTPSKVVVDAVRIRPTKPQAGAAVYGDATPHVPDGFDFPGWKQRLADCKTLDQLAEVRAALNAAKPPGQYASGLRKAIAATEDAIAWAALTPEERAKIEEGL